MQWMAKGTPNSQLQSVGQALSLPFLATPSFLQHQEWQAQGLPYIPHPNSPWVNRRHRRDVILAAGRLTPCLWAQLQTLLMSRDRSV